MECSILLLLVVFATSVIYFLVPPSPLQPPTTRAWGFLWCDTIYIYSLVVLLLPPSLLLLLLLLTYIDYIHSFLQASHATIFCYKREKKKESWKSPRKSEQCNVEGYHVDETRGTYKYPIYFYPTHLDFPVFSNKKVIRDNIYVTFLRIFRFIRSCRPHNNFLWCALSSLSHWISEKEKNWRNAAEKNCSKNPSYTLPSHMPTASPKKYEETTHVPPW